MYLCSQRRHSNPTLLLLPTDISSQHCFGCTTQTHCLRTKETAASDTSFGAIGRYFFSSLFTKRRSSHLYVFVPPELSFATFPRMRQRLACNPSLETRFVFLPVSVPFLVFLPVPVRLLYILFFLTEGGEVPVLSPAHAPFLARWWFWFFSHGNFWFDRMKRCATRILATPVLIFSKPSASTKCRGQVRAKPRVVTTSVETLRQHASRMLRVGNVCRPGTPTNRICAAAWLGCRLCHRRPRLHCFPAMPVVSRIVISFSQVLSATGRVPGCQNRVPISLTRKTALAYEF